jgi:hypothetical protein
VESGDRPEIGTVGWLLRHPVDHWLHQAAHAVSDPDCKALIESLIAKLQPEL